MEEINEELRNDNTKLTEDLLMKYEDLKARSNELNTRFVELAKETNQALNRKEDKSKKA